MGLSCRLFLLSGDDALYRLATTTFARMLREPGAFRLPEFAGRRVRMVEAIVELTGEAPRGLLRSTFSVLSFDAAGRFDAGRFGSQQFARVERGLARVLGTSDHDGTVVEAASHFVAQGGTWRPSDPLRRDIEAAVLGQVKCRRLKVISE